MICGDDLGRHAAAPLAATWLVRYRLSDEGERSPVGLGLLDSSVSQRQELPWPGGCGGWGWLPLDAHPGAGDSVTRPAVHVIQNIRQPGGS
jgi:hypothetical protein